MCTKLDRWVYFKGEKCNEINDKIGNSISDLKISKLHEPI
jgi:hypothetical protein